jgi:tetratricopeptide (TPR) repeat protein
MYREAILRMRAALGDRHMDVATAENNLAGLLRTTGRYDEAREIFGRVISVYRERLGDDHIWNAIVAENLARVEELAERWNDALVMTDEALRVIESRNDETLRPRWLQVASLRARCLLEEDPGAAVSLARSVWAEMQSTLPAEHRARAVAKPRIVEILRRTGHEAEADGVNGE